MVASKAGSLNIAARHNMVTQQLATNKITDMRVIEAMEALPREIFLPEDYQKVAYMDGDAPIDPPPADAHLYDYRGRVLLEPMVAARLLQLAEIEEPNHVLDVGGGTGYTACLASHLAKHVVAVECDESLAARAVALCKKWAKHPVRVVSGALASGVESGAVFDAIIIAGGVDVVPTALEDQLKEGGRLVAVVNAPESRHLAHVVQGRKTGGHVSYRRCFDTAARLLPGMGRPKEFQF